MPRPSPFHTRTQPLCSSWRWKDWAGYAAVCRYDHTVDAEYNAIRQGAGLLDVTPLFKYEVVGPDAGACLSRVMVKDVSRLRVGRMTYLCWTDDHGKVLDDGTCARLAEDRYRVTSASPALAWLCRHAAGFRVEIADVTERIAALALQGPRSREVLRGACDADVDALKFFGVVECDLAGARGWVSRTGYTGDLGYELWAPAEHALALWDAVVAAGRDHGLRPVGLDALDITRVEAGFILQGVDYHAANEAVIEAHKSSPFELGLGWTVTLGDRDPPFVGEAALAAEKARGGACALVGLDIDWDSLERMYAEAGLPAALPAEAWRCQVPVYKGGRQVGRATSGAWSPLLKRNLALATVETSAAAPGAELSIDWMVDWRRRQAPCTVVPTPFFDPPRKRA